MLSAQSDEQEISICSQLLKCGVGLFFCPLSMFWSITLSSSSIDISYILIPLVVFAVKFCLSFRCFQDMLAWRVAPLFNETLKSGQTETHEHSSVCLEERFESVHYP